MKTMLDKAVVAGDITQPIDRRGAESVAVTVIGGTAGTEIIMKSSDTANGVYTDYLTIVSAADSGDDTYKGAVVDLSGAKKYIKITGAKMATAVLGDCDADIKKIAIVPGTIPQSVTVEALTATENRTYTEEGKAYSPVTVNVPLKLYAWQSGGETVYTCYTATDTPEAGDTAYLATADGLAEREIADVASSAISIVTTEETTETMTRYIAGDIEL